MIYTQFTFYFTSIRIAFTNERDRKETRSQISKNSFLNKKSSRILNLMEIFREVQSLRISGRSSYRDQFMFLHCAHVKCTSTRQMRCRQGSNNCEILLCSVFSAK
jgi:hypothetical protein